MKTYTAWVTIKQKGTKNTIRLRANRLSEEAADELQNLFVWEILNDPNRVARNEFGEGLEKAKAGLAPTTNTKDKDDHGERTLT